MDQPASSRPSGSTPIRQRRILTPRQFHEEVDGVIGINTIYELLQTHRIRHVKIGSRYKIPYSEIDEFFIREARGENHA